MKVTDKITSRLNSVEHFTKTAPFYFLPIKILAWFVLFIVLMISNLIAILCWPIVTFVSLFHGKQTRSEGLVDIRSFDQLEELTRTNHFVLLDFWAQWCGPCMLMNPTVKDLSDYYSGQLTVAKIDASLHPKLCNKFTVRGLPTFIFIRKGEELDRKSGTLTFDDLKNWIDISISS